jgi:FKBP-type peptidyl-prolyl cis-trans isomerase FkpA
LSDLKKSFSKTNPYYNKQQTMKVTNGALAALLALTLGACGNVDFKKTKGGMPYKVFAGKGGQKLDSGDIAKVHIIQKIHDSVTFDSYKSGAPQYIPVMPNGNPYDFTEVLPTLKVGDSMYAVQVMDTFIARNPQMIPPQFKKGDKIETSVKVIGAFKNPDAAQKDQMTERNQAFDKDTMVQNQLVKDDAAIKAYLQSNNISAQKAGKGTYVQILDEGTGAPVQEGKYVSLKYTGATFEGKVFDTNADASKGHTEPLIFQVGSQGMIRGFDEGLRQLREGSRAKLYIPSMLAYGPQPPPSSDIKPFENLVFDIEVLKVSDQPIQAPNPAPRPRLDSAAR